MRFEREPESAPGVRVASQTGERSRLIADAEALTRIEDSEVLIDEALRALVAREAALRLIRLGGKMPEFTAPDRERPFS